MIDPRAPRSAMIHYHFFSGPVMRSLRRGFTLVELLVVITIIGLLAALIVPAVQGAMETARTNNCRNNMVQSGKAAIGYAARKNYFPGYLNPKLNTSQTNMTSWQVALLNDLDQGSNYKAWINNDTAQINANAPYLEVFICPSDNTAVGQTGPFVSFVANTGKTGDKTTDPYSDPWEGVFHDLSNSSYANKRKVALDGIPDGASTTILFSENLDADKYTATTEPILGFQWATANPYINKTGGTGRPSSNHTSVVNVVFAGGNAKTIDEAIDYKVWNSLMTPDGKNKNMPAADITAQQFPLQEGSF
jgi:prepilin-type N-terminal cleavage/methylation domain-containing protein